MLRSALSWVGSGDDQSADDERVLSLGEEADDEEAPEQQQQLPNESTEELLPLVAGFGHIMPGDNIDGVDNGASDTSKASWTYDVGDKVEALLEQGSTWFAGTITKKNSDGTFDVVYEDGDREHEVAEEFIRGRVAAVETHQKSKGRERKRAGKQKPRPGKQKRRRKAEPKSGARWYRTEKENEKLTHIASKFAIAVEKLVEINRGQSWMLGKLTRSSRFKRKTLIRLDARVKVPPDWVADASEEDEEDDVCKICHRPANRENPLIRCEGKKLCKVVVHPRCVGLNFEPGNYECERCEENIHPSAAKCVACPLSDASLPMKKLSGIWYHYGCIGKEPKKRAKRPRGRPRKVSEAATKAKEGALWLVRRWGTGYDPLPARIRSIDGTGATVTFEADGKDKHVSLSRLIRPLLDRDEDDDKDDEDEDVNQTAAGKRSTYRRKKKKKKDPTKEKSKVREEEEESKMSVEESEEETGKTQQGSNQDHASSSKANVGAKERAAARAAGAKRPRHVLTEKLRKAVWDVVLAPPLLREKVSAREGSGIMCPVCRLNEIKKEKGCFHCAHIDASRTGTGINAKDELWNMVPSCSACNSEMGTQCLFDYMAENPYRAVNIKKIAYLKTKYHLQGGGLQKYSTAPSAKDLHRFRNDLGDLDFASYIKEAYNCKLMDDEDNGNGYRRLLRLNVKQQEDLLYSEWK